MKNLLNLMKKQGDKPIYRSQNYLQGKKPLKLSWENREENRVLID